MSAHRSRLLCACLLLLAASPLGCPGTLDNPEAFLDASSAGGGGSDAGGSGGKDAGKEGGSDAKADAPAEAASDAGGG